MILYFVKSRVVEKYKSDGGEYLSRSKRIHTWNYQQLSLRSFFLGLFSVKLYSGPLYRLSVFATILSLPCRIAGNSKSVLVRNAASFILPVPYVSDFSITAARYFTDNLRVANGVHNEAEMAWCSDGPRICLHSVPSPVLLLSVSEHAPFTLPPPGLSCHPMGKSAINCAGTSRSLLD